jgi:hypothetical protein
LGSDRKLGGWGEEREMGERAAAFLVLALTPAPRRLPLSFFSLRSKRNSRPPERRVDGSGIVQRLQLGRRQGGPAGGLGGGGDGLVGLRERAGRGERGGQEKEEEKKHERAPSASPL